MKIGVFGGTFNPPHKGHEYLAESAVEHLKLDKLIIVPSSIPPHKTAGKLADSADRLEMCRLAFADCKAEISDIELKREGKSYTVDTLRELKAVYPEDELYFIFGSDMLESFTRWYRWEEILGLAKICACSREKGFEPDLSAFSDEQKKRIDFMSIAPLELSSTELRSMDFENPDEEKISRSVAGYIVKNKLYDDGLSDFRKLLREKLDDFRLFHSECVSEAAASLAESYGADPDKARLAGLLHDVMKNASPDEQLEYIDGLTEVEKCNLKVWHQISGEGFLRKNKIIADEEILSAVRWHTTGRAGMSLLEKIVYTADFISADREYKDVEVVRKLASISLEHAILYTSRYTVEKLSSKDMLIHPATIECYNDMLLHFSIGCYSPL